MKNITESQKGTSAKKYLTRARSISTYNSSACLIFPEEYKEDLQNCLQMFHENMKQPVNTCAKDDITIVKDVGEGANGKVLLVTNKKTGSYHAMKAISKKQIVEGNKLSYAKSERDILNAIRFPFTIHLNYYFQDNSYIYFIMPFMPGGDLFSKLNALGKFTERQSRFCAAQIVLGVEYLHSIDLVYRDLKPENILIDKDGYLKLSDFGNSKFLKSRTWTTCGTPEYLAPEVYLQKGYGKAVDWWALGVLIYEMNHGKSPFYAKGDIKVCNNILQNQYTYPEYFGEDLRLLISNLLQPDLSQRFGNLRNGVNDIKTHKWFKSFDWIALFNRKLEPAFLVQTHDFMENVKPANNRISLIEAEEDEYAKEFENF